MKPVGPLVRKLEHIADELRAEGKTSLAEEVAEVIQEVKQTANGHPPHQSRDDVMTTGDAARLLGIRSINTIKRWAIDGLLEGYRRGGRILVSRASVERMINSSTVADQKRFEADQDKALDPFDVDDGGPLLSYTHNRGLENSSMERKQSVTGDADLIARYIELNPRRPGKDRAQIKGFGVEVWVLIAYYQEGAARDIDTVARDYDIPVDAVRAALAYYARERDFIDARIKLLDAD